MKDQKAASRFKAFKDRLTLLFCGYASGDLKYKLLLVYCAEITHALKGENKEHMPVWR
jgi:hypothetical protein